MAIVLPSRSRVAAEAFELQMKRRRWIAGCSLVLLLWFSTVGLLPLMGGGDVTDVDGQGDWVRQAFMLVLLAMSLFAPWSARPPMSVPVSLLILFGYCLLSATWAIDPALSLKRLALTALVVWILVRDIGDLGAVRTIRILRVLLAVLLALNFLAVIFSPLGRHISGVGEDISIAGAWRGMTSHKNVAGPTCAFTILLFAFDRSRIQTWIANLVIAGSVVFLWMTQSKMSVLALAIALATGAAMLLYNPRHRSLALPVGLIVSTGLICLMIMLAVPAQNILDDPYSFSHRAEIWSLLFTYAGEHLWTGAGFMSFWKIGPSSPIWTLTNSWVASSISHGHNGYLDLLITIGLPGLLLAVAVVFVWPGLRLLFSTAISRPRRALLVSLLAFAAAHNMSESTLLDRTSTVQIILMIAVIMIHRLSSQSEGAHQRLRGRMVELARRARIAGVKARNASRDGRALRRRTTGYKRSTYLAKSNSAEDSIA